MFQKATRKKIRFESPQGLLSVEDLWDLPLTATRGANLDDIAKGLFRQVKEAEIVSFVNKTNPDDTTQLKFDLVKHIIEVRLADAQLAADAKANKEKKQNILAIIAQKENEHLAGSSLDDLRKMAESL